MSSARARDPRFVRAALRQRAPAKILSPGHAFDLPVAGQDRAWRRRAPSPGRRCDINLVATDKRRKKLLVADMDSTIINVECLDELADMAGLKPQIAAITERAMRGELEFEAALRERVGMLKGCSSSALERTYAERVRLNPGAKSLLATMRAQRRPHHAGLRRLHLFHPARGAGGGLSCRTQATRLLDDGDGADRRGRRADPGPRGQAGTRWKKPPRHLKIDFAETLAVGDGANDLAMIQRAGLGVAYHAKPVVAEAAGAAIIHGDLTALLYLQGYQRRRDRSRVSDASSSFQRHILRDRRRG